MLRIAVCDDELKDLNHTAGLLHEILIHRQLPYEIRTFLSAKELLENMEKIDIGVLDIVMKEINGIDLGKKLLQRFPDIRLIYTTSFQQYCIQAVNETHAFSFLCKPLDRKKMEEQITASVKGITGQALQKTFSRVVDSSKREYASVKLNLQDIIYIEYIKRQRRAAIVLENEVYEYDCVFERLAEELESYHFAVNCRGSLVNLRHVVRIKGYVIHLDTGKELSISQKRITEFRRRMNEFVQNNSR